MIATDTSYPHHKDYFVYGLGGSVGAWEGGGVVVCRFANDHQNLVFSFAQVLDI